MRVELVAGREWLRRVGAQMLMRLAGHEWLEAGVARGHYGAWGGVR